jgi:hypothetical protein
MAQGVAFVHIRETCSTRPVFLGSKYRQFGTSRPVFSGFKLLTHGAQLHPRQLQLRGNTRGQGPCFLLYPA